MLLAGQQYRRTLNQGRKLLAGEVGIYAIMHGLKLDVARRLLGDLAYRSEALEKALAGSGVLLVTERSRQNGKRQQIEIALASLKRVFRLGETLATTLMGLVTRIAAKICAYTYAFLVNRRLEMPQGRIKAL
jgi:hypothetical protein